MLFIFGHFRSVLKRSFIRDPSYPRLDLFAVFGRLQRRYVKGLHELDPLRHGNLVSKVHIKDLM
jgi:hypothetical protein